MEAISAKKVRVFRGKETILNILNDYKKSNLSIKAFCQDNKLASATFHNWKKKYSNTLRKPDVQPGFATLQITPSAPIVAPALFAEVKGIKIFQPVTAAYLKELLA
jgi:hypothetical protein